MIDVIASCMSLIYRHFTDKTSGNNLDRGLDLMWGKMRSTPDTGDSIDEASNMQQSSEMRARSTKMHDINAKSSTLLWEDIASVAREQDGCSRIFPCPLLEEGILQLMVE